MAVVQYSNIYYLPLTKTKFGTHLNIHGKKRSPSLLLAINIIDFIVLGIYNVLKEKAGIKWNFSRQKLWEV